MPSLLSQERDDDESIISSEDDDDKRSEASLSDDDEDNEERSCTQNNVQLHMRHSLSLPDLSISENTLVSQLQNELLRANTTIETSYRQLSRLYNNNTDLNEQLKKAEELNNVLLEHIEDQVQQLTQLFQEENEEQ
ncbi:MAG: hypothetical protein ACR5KX_00925 [Wolbachia sp.]